MALLIREEEVLELLTMKEAVAAVEGVFKLLGDHQADNRPRQRPRLDRSMLHAMAGAATGVGLGLKAYTVTQKGVRFLVALWDDESGDLLAVIEAGHLGRIRTGAASGVASKFLARSDATTAGILGAGFQADAQLEAICAVRPITEAFVYSRTEPRLRAFAEAASARLGIPVHPVDRAADAARCDIVATITNSREPLFSAADLREGAHLNAAGSNRAEAAEIDPEVFRKVGRVFIDDRRQGEVEAGDLLRAVSAGSLTWDRVSELGALVAGRLPGRENRSQITLFESLGIAVEDIAVARCVYEAALARGAGDPLPKSILG